MAGSPVRRARRAIEDATRALAEGRQDDARRALADLKRCMNESGIDLPELPAEIAALWVQVTAPSPPRPRSLTTVMGDNTRTALLQAGEIAAERLLAFLQDDRMFGYAGILSPDQQMVWLNLALQRGFGSMAAGAQKVPIPSSPSEPQAIGNTLQLLVRARQQQGVNGAPVDVEVGGVVDDPDTVDNEAEETRWQ